MFACSCTNRNPGPAAVAVALLYWSLKEKNARLPAATFPPREVLRSAHTCTLLRLCEFPCAGRRSHAPRRALWCVAIVVHPLLQQILARQRAASDVAARSRSPTPRPHHASACRRPMTPSLYLLMRAQSLRSRAPPPDPRGEWFAGDHSRMRPASRAFGSISAPTSLPPLAARDALRTSSPSALISPR